MVKNRHILKQIQPTTTNRLQLAINMLIVNVFKYVLILWRHQTFTIVYFYNIELKI